MDFDSHAERVAGVCVQMVNALTPGRERGRDVPPLQGDELQARAGAIVGRPLTPEEAGALARAARRLRPVFEAVDRHDVDAAADAVNRLIRTYRPAPLLARHDGEPWHLHFHGPHGDPADDWAAGCVTALAYVLGGPARERLGVCSAAGCDRVFIDVSRNGSRRFCGTACQSRTKAAAFRARRHRS